MGSGACGCTAGTHIDACVHTPSMSNETYTTVLI